MQRVAQRVHEEPRGVLKLTCGVEFGMMTVSQWIDGYLTRYPRVSVDADFTGRVIDIVHEGFDLAIRVGELPDSRLAARRLGELYYGLFASPSYLARRGMPGTPEELSRHDLLVFTAGMHRAVWRLVKEDQIKRIDTPGRLRVNSHFAVRGAAAEGLGIAQLPLALAEPELSSGTLIEVLPDWRPAVVPVHALFPSHRYLTPKVRAFVDHAVEAFSAGSFR